MKNTAILIFLIGFLSFIGCSDDDTPTAVQPSACDIATANATDAANALPATSDANYSTKCNAYKIALQAKITACGDANGNIQAIIDDLGNCSGVTFTPKTYNADVAPIFAHYCLNCHNNPPTNGAFSSFNTYDLVKTGVQSGNVLNRINNSNYPMPISGLMPLISRNTIQQWANDGYLQN